MTDIRERDAILTILSTEAGDIAPRRLEWELSNIGVQTHGWRDVGAAALRAGCHVTAFGTLAIMPAQRVCDEPTRYERGLVLEALSYEYRAACPEWAARRAALIRGWVVDDARRGVHPMRRAPRISAPRDRRAE